jgi:hypothetical protein
MTRARWYEAVGGDGLEVQSDGGDWRIYGLVQKNHGCYYAILNRDFESFSLGRFGTKQQAKDYLLRRSGATLEPEVTA